MSSQCPPLRRGGVRLLELELVGNGLSLALARRGGVLPVCLVTLIPISRCKLDSEALRTSSYDKSWPVKLARSNRMHHNAAVMRSQKLRFLNQLKMFWSRAMAKGRKAIGLEKNLWVWWPIAIDTTNHHLDFIYSVLCLIVINKGPWRPPAAQAPNNPPYAYGSAQNNPALPQCLNYSACLWDFYFAFVLSRAFFSWVQKGLWLWIRFPAAMSLVYEHLKGMSLQTHWN